MQLNSNDEIIKKAIKVGGGSDPQLCVLMTFYAGYDSGAS